MMESCVAGIDAAALLTYIFTTIIPFVFLVEGISTIARVAVILAACPLLYTYMCPHVILWLTTLLEHNQYL